MPNHLSRDWYPVLDRVRKSFNNYRDAVAELRKVSRQVLHPSATTLIRRRISGTDPTVLETDRRLGPAFDRWSASERHAWCADFVPCHAAVYALLEKLRESAGWLRDRDRGIQEALAASADLDVELPARLLRSLAVAKVMLWTVAEAEQLLEETKGSLLYAAFIACDRPEVEDCLARAAFEDNVQFEDVVGAVLKEAGGWKRLLRTTSAEMASVHRGRMSC